MKALVVYESMFGNTRAVAEAVAAGLGEYAEVTLTNVDDVASSSVTDADLIVVGGPTHAFSMSRAKTRSDAASRRQSLITQTGSLRDLLQHLPTATDHYAVFGTKSATPRWLPGSAARSAAKALRREKARVIAPPEDFYVTDMEGPLAEGELKRAREWGRALALKTTSV